MVLHVGRRSRPMVLGVGRRSLDRLRQWLLAGLLLISAGAVHAALADAPCPSFPPVSYLTAQGFYTDPRGSMANPAVVKQNSDLSADVTRFMRYAEQALDGSGAGPNRPSAACAYDAFKNWAMAGALTTKPPVFNREGGMETRQFTVGLNVLALKFKAAGYPIDATIIGWLHTLTDQDMAYFQSGGNNQANLYKWSGAAAALFAILSHDPAALQYQDQVWQSAIASIQPDGTIGTELKRGRNALFYHDYSLLAMLLQRAARQVLGYPTSPADLARLKQLAAMIGRALCNPQILETPAQTTTLEMPKDWGYRIPLAFGRDVLTPDWTRCGIPSPAGSDLQFGGDEQRTAALLQKMAK